MRNSQVSRQTQNQLSNGTLASQSSVQSVSMSTTIRGIAPPQVSDSYSPLEQANHVQSQSISEQHACVAVAHYSSLGMQAFPGVARKVAAISHRGHFAIQIMFVNNRISVQSSHSEPLDSLLNRISAYFKINSLETPVGLIKRSSQNNGSKQKPYELIENQCMLRNGELYFLYFREANPGESILGSSPAIKTHKAKNNLNNASLLDKSLAQSRTPETQIKKVKRLKSEFKLLICPFERCLKEFRETGNLKTHMRTHTGERPFKCEQCDMQFITKGHLQAHELIHTGLKPFVCQFLDCKKKYSRAGRLRIHQRLHTGERPFICPVKNCEKSFREKGNLLTHARSHANRDLEGQKAPQGETNGDTMVLDPHQPLMLKGAAQVVQDKMVAQSSRQPRQLQEQQSSDDSPPSSSSSLSRDDLSSQDSGNEQNLHFNQLNEPFQHNELGQSMRDPNRHCGSHLSYINQPKAVGSKIKAQIDLKEVWAQPKVFKPRYHQTKVIIQPETSPQQHKSQAVSKVALAHQQIQSMVHQRPHEQDFLGEIFDDRAEAVQCDKNDFISQSTLHQDAHYQASVEKFDLMRPRAQKLARKRLKMASGTSSSALHAMGPSDRRQVGFQDDVQLFTNLPDGCSNRIEHVLPPFHQPGPQLTTQQNNQEYNPHQMMQLGAGIWQNPQKMKAATSSTPLIRVRSRTMARDQLHQHDMNVSVPGKAGNQNEARMDGDGEVIVCEENSFKIDFSYYKKKIDTRISGTSYAALIPQRSATGHTTKSTERLARPDLGHCKEAHGNAALSQEILPSEEQIRLRNVSFKDVNNELAFSMPSVRRNFGNSTAINDLRSPFTSSTTQADCLVPLAHIYSEPASQLCEKIASQYQENLNLADQSNFFNENMTSGRAKDQHRGGCSNTPLDLPCANLVSRAFHQPTPASHQPSFALDSSTIYDSNSFRVMADQPSFPPLQPVASQDYYQRQVLSSNDGGEVQKNGNDVIGYHSKAAIDELSLQSLKQRGAAHLQPSNPHTQRSLDSNFQQPHQATQSQLASQVFCSDPQKIAVSSLQDNGLFDSLVARTTSSPEGQQKPRQDSAGFTASAVEDGEGAGWVYHREEPEQPDTPARLANNDQQSNEFYRLSVDSMFDQNE